MLNIKKMMFLVITVLFGYHKKAQQRCKSKWKYSGFLWTASRIYIASALFSKVGGAAWRTNGIKGIISVDKRDLVD